MSLRSGSAVFKLSNEVLAQIFQHFVDKAWPHSPVVLTHVCQLWRQLVQSTSSFWKFIDLSLLQRVERAEHHFAFAQEQLLVVNWQNVVINATRYRKKPSNLDKYERIFAQASRFTDLSLLFHGQDIVELFDRFSHHELSNLRSLKVAAMPWSEDPFTPGCMPNLRHLILSKTTMTNFRDTLLSCPLLETLEVTGGFGKYRTQANHELAPVELPHLKSCTMLDVQHEDQGFFMSLIAYPKHCKLHITPIEIVVHCDRPVLHPAVIAMHRPIQMTTIGLGRAGVVYTESQQESRCAIEVDVFARAFRIGEIPPNWNMDLWHGFHFDSVTTFVINSTALLNEGYNEDYVSRVLEHALPRIRQLVLRLTHMDSLRWPDALFSRRHRDFGEPPVYALPELETIVLQDMNVDTSSSSYGRSQYIQTIKEFVGQVQSTKAMKLVLRDCKTDQNGLDMLRSILPVDIECT